MRLEHQKEDIKQIVEGRVTVIRFSDFSKIQGQNLEKSARRFNLKSKPC